MPVVPHTVSTYNNSTQWIKLLTAPVQSFFKGEFKNDNTGSGRSWTGNKTYANLPESQDPRYELTDLLYQQQSRHADSEYQQPTMCYQQAPTERSQGGPTNASTGYPGPSNYSSHPVTSQQPASRGSYQSTPTARNDSGGNLAEIDLTPSGSGRGHRASEGPDYIEPLGETSCQGESWAHCVDWIMSC